MKQALETTPLIQREVAVPVAPAAVTRVQYVASSVIATLHLLRGFALVIFPATVLAGFALPKSYPAFLLTTILGVRDIVLGGLLLMTDAGRSYEVQRALGIALFSDSIDTFVMIFVVACSGSGRNPVAEIVSVALLAILEHLTLWSFGDDDDDGPSPSYQAVLQVDRLEDKRLRLGMWLEDLKRAEEAEQQGLSSPKHDIS
ncbi:hypothetical protein QQS21_010931 [Conoideocrella luteorostrata]|uniref:Uncharacterized protein n=1 Tax=Conoideocrella luteorostrata TaxID=1105319 RepID=A0AAJ0FP05_9HYPO|nr:hypothetical protein QQS21_010931 [Conoideocrella luteorostrata]